MDSTRASQTYTAALERNEVYGSLGLRYDVPKVLDPQEEVLLVLPGVAGQFPSVMLATRQRVLVAEVTGGFKGAKIEREAPAGQVRAVSFRGGLLSRVKIEVDGGKDLAMGPNRRADAEQFVASFEHLLRTGRLPD